MMRVAKYMCFDKFCAKDETKVPVWTFWATDAVWPLTSDAGRSGGIGAGMH